MATDKGKVIRHPGILQTLSVLLDRAVLASKLGSQYGGDRDVYEALGYKTVLTYNDYAARYERQDIAAAIIDRPAQATWRGGFTILDTEDDEDTEFEKRWAELYTSLDLLSKFSRLDRLTGIGRYGVLFLGLSDVSRSEDLIQPVAGTGHKLLYVRPFGEGSAQVGMWETDTSNERYGQPTQYTIMSSDLSTGNTMTLYVHHSRVIHVVDRMLESEIEGESRLRQVYNRLMDLEKIVGASAEMFWRGARPGYQGKVQDDFTLTDEMKDDLQDEIDEFEHKLRRILLLQGVDLKALAPQVSDPAKHVDVQIQMISAQTGIPKRILTGSERGELASTEDKSSWFELLEGRREDFAESRIIRPFVDRCIELGVLPSPTEGGYAVRWPDLWTPSDKDKAEVGKIILEGLAKYADSLGAHDILPPEAVLEYVLGLDRDVIKVVAEMKEAQEEEEQRAMAQAGAMPPGPLEAPPEGDEV